MQKTSMLRKSFSDRLPEADKSDCRIHCRAGRSNCWIDWRGNMGMCGMIPAEDNSVLKNGFLKCWEKVKNSSAQIRLPQKCIDCKYKTVCNVCAAVCICETGKYDAAPEYMCRYSQLIYDKLFGLEEE